VLEAELARAVVLLLRRGRPTMVVVLSACIVCVGGCVGFWVREM